MNRITMNPPGTPFKPIVSRVIDKRGGATIEYLVKWTSEIDYGIIYTWVRAADLNHQANIACAQVRRRPYARRTPH